MSAARTAGIFPTRWCRSRVESIRCPGEDSSGHGFAGLIEPDQLQPEPHRSIDIIPNWLALSVAFTWDDSSQESVTNILTQPWNGTIVSVSQLLHRLGAVLHLTQYASLYALAATTFTPPGSGSILETGVLYVSGRKVDPIRIKFVSSKCTPH